MEPEAREGVLAEIEVGPLTTEDLVGISDLISDMSTGRGDQRLRDKSPDYYRWMYLDNPVGRATVYSARHRGRVVSSFAVAPKRVQLGERQVTLGKTMDMFTDPEYQGLGLIKRCTDAVFRSARETGMDGWYVTPSVNSYPIFTGKWGYREDFGLVYRTRIFDYAAVLGEVPRARAVARVVGAALGLAGRIRGQRPYTPPPGHSVRRIAEFGADADRLWAEVGGGYRVALVRDAEYLNWRYVQNPDSYTAYGLHRGDRLIGIVVVTTTIRRGLTVGEIMDYVCGAEDSTTFRALMGIAVDHFRGLGCSLCEAWSIPGTKQDRRLRAAGLRIARTRIKFLISPDFPDPLVYEPDAWLLTQGDGNDV